MMRSLLALTLLALTLASSNSAFADLVFYTDRAEWESNSENLVFEDFEEAITELEKYISTGKDPRDRTLQCYFINIKGAPFCFC